MGLPLRGDVVVAIWFADHVGEWDPPALCYAFHTAFEEPGVLRVLGSEVDAPGTSPATAAAAAAEGFWMDLVLEEEE